MTSRYQCVQCGREWVYSVTGCCPVCPESFARLIEFTPVVPGLDSTTTAEDLPCAPSDIPPLSPTPTAAPPPLVLQAPAAYLLDLGERL